MIVLLVMFDIFRLIVVLLSVVIYRKYISDGMMIVFSMNFWIVLLCEMWVRNRLIKGENVIYYV